MTPHEQAETFIAGIERYFPPDVLGFIRLGFIAGASGMDTRSLLHAIDEQCGDVESGSAAEELQGDSCGRKDGAATHQPHGCPATALSRRPDLREGYFKQHWQQRAAKPARTAMSSDGQQMK